MPLLKLGKDSVYKTLHGLQYSKSYVISKISNHKLFEKILTFKKKIE